MKRFVPIFLILFVFSSSFVFAQNEDGSLKPIPTKPTRKKSSETTPTKKKTIAPKKSQNPAKTSPKTGVKTKPKSKTKSAKIVYANLTLTVNQPNSEIFLSNADGNVFEDQESALTDEQGVLEINEVPNGSYTLTVRKKGFYDEERKISVTGGRVNSVSIFLRPSTAFLSVKTNVEGVSIEIENVGEYQNGVENLLLDPGTYRVSAHKNGYISETKSVSIDSVGQKGQLSFVLNPLPVSEFLSLAETDLKSGDWNKALRRTKRVLAVEPDNAKANLLAGLAYFQSSNPQDSVYLLSRAIGFGDTVSLPVRVYNKEKGNLQLIAGNLIFRKNSLEFISANRTELNFLTTQTQFSELFEKIDEFGLKYISLKARGDFNGKTDRRTVRLYSQHAAVRASKKELMCPNCPEKGCPCQAEETALYDLINRWRNGNFLAFEPNFGAVIFPSEDFEVLQSARFSLKLPENWQVLAKNDKQILAAPIGGYYKVPNAANIYYSHGIDAIIADNPNRLDLDQATGNISQSLLTNNPYLKSGTVSTLKLPFGTCRLSTFKGVSPVSKRAEIINLYTAITPSGEIFFITTVIPPDESADYEAVFRRILNSVSFN